MLEYPEIRTIIKQMENEIIGKTVESGAMVKHNNNMFMNEGHVAQYSLLSGGTVIKIDCLAPDIYIRLDNGYGILICQSGGKILYNRTVSEIPKNYNIIFKFTDGGSITYTMSLFTLGFFAVSHDDWQKRKQNNQKFDPFGNNSFDDYIDFIGKRPVEETKKPIKTFLATNILGVMSTFAAEILLYAKLYPSTQTVKLSEEENKRVYDKMHRVLTEATNAGGRKSEFDLYGKKGGYIAMVERKYIGENCPVCGRVLEKNSTAGVTAFCPNCQIKKAK
jgi:formamidopyrimidine-DNA glycosylase